MSNPGRIESMQCDKKVADEFGVDFHRCTRNAIENSIYCQQHYDQLHPPEFEAAAHQTPPSRHVSVSLTARLSWSDEDGPVVKRPYSPSVVRVDHLSLHPALKSYRVEVFGRVLKKDGSPSKVTANFTVYDDATMEVFPRETAAVIAANIDTLRADLERLTDG